MAKLAATAIVLVILFSTDPASASPWTEGQAEWFRHGARHGRWDCWGKCPEGRAHRGERRRGAHRQR
ncbi:MAG: hypothetical protein AB7F41_06385 [Methylocystis sp.]|uniref:hypothetical protein n=1 Tax=Methylocystis sp. TaxID=1911079 RepID=UPI003D0EE537